MKYKTSGEELKKRTSPLPHSCRNSRNYFLLLTLPLLVFALLAGCPVYDLPYFEFPLNNFQITNITIEGAYVPQEGAEKTPVLLYYLDGTFDFGYVADTGSVFIKNKDTSNRRGKIFYHLYLRTEEVPILLGRKFDENPVRFKLDAQGQLQLREEVPNPNDGGAPYIPIDTMGEFLHINGDSALWGGSYLLTGALDMLGGADRGALRLNWNPIGNASSGRFTGKFDGGGREIRNLYIDSPDDNIGLFGMTNNAVLRNIVIGSGSVQGNSCVGGIAGFSSGGEISGCSNGAEVTSGYGNAGGIAGYSQGAAITTCYNTGAVTTTSSAGGIAGDNSGSITACYNTGAVTATVSNGGGIAGDNSSGNITYCYWLSASGGNASQGIGNPPGDSGAAPFNNSGNWPSLTGNWAPYMWTQSGDEKTPQKYWKSAGQWSQPPIDGSKSEFPKLWWQP
ncbi:MAG: hypothetical protein LBC67_03930 [Spirochaetales bacterium]|jgi:hypothetical protein|nr:hypothetical protein [Spirochaetales bacterium]